MLLVSISYTVLQDAWQGDRSIQNFHTLLSGYWEELHMMEVLIPDTRLDFALALSNNAIGNTCTTLLWTFVQSLRDYMVTFFTSVAEAVAKFTSEETCLQMLLSTTPKLSSPSTSFLMVLAAPHRPTSSRCTSSTYASSSHPLFCNNCRKRGHMIADCQIWHQYYGSNNSNSLQLLPLWIVQILFHHYLSRSYRHPS